ncbi:glycine cleavage system protein H [Paraphotobacterium marinum]|uniref:Glycine cleavage system H protein n=1 Tax=Paraphotobacterium marinum TaxID=1755811 RepID=A0A220VFF4_9GAMM|nr:glycine cleavage system protein GcvH [Paraphotobacterium marinum]ASK78956.1 glycine cleavage system protein H [Paraphotobacterium marinum]
MTTNLKFTETHEWIRLDADDTAFVGISDHAQQLLGDVVFVELPEVGDEITMGDNFSLVESVKAASDIYAPLTGEIIEVNEDLTDNPELINEDPEDRAWIAKIKLSDPSEIENLFTEEQYKENVVEED